MLEFYEEGEFALNFVRIRESKRREVHTLSYFESRKGKEPYERNDYDSKFQLIVKVKGIEGKIDPF